MQGRRTRLKQKNKVLTFYMVIVAAHPIDPRSNTGLNSQTVHGSSSVYPLEGTASMGQTALAPSISIDGFSLMWDELDSFDILPIIKQLLLVEFDFTKSTSMTIGVRWDYVYRGSLGALYMYRHTPTGLRYRLSIPGKVCTSIPLRLVLRFFEVVSGLNDELDCSRIDICVDDFTKKLTFDNITTALKQKNYSGFRTKQGIQNYDALNGWTVYLGSRQSEHMVRIYNKSAESMGRIDAIRWESEYKGKKANSIFKSLSKAIDIESSVKLLKGYVLGKVNFIDRFDKNLERCDLLDWWREFVEYLGYERCQVLCEKVVTSIESKVKWINKQVEKALALVSRAFGSERFQVFIDECVNSGSDRLRRFDELLLVEYMNGQNM